MNDNYDQHQRLQKVRQKIDEILLKGDNKNELKILMEYEQRLLVEINTLNGVYGPSIAQFNNKR